MKQQTEVYETPMKRLPKNLLNKEKGPVERQLEYFVEQQLNFHAITSLKLCVATIRSYSEIKT